MNEWLVSASPQALASGLDERIPVIPADRPRAGRIIPSTSSIGEQPAYALQGRVRRAPRSLKDIGPDDPLPNRGIAAANCSQPMVQRSTERKPRHPDSQGPGFRPQWSYRLEPRSRPCPWRLLFTAGDVPDMEYNLVRQAASRVLHRLKDDLKHCRQQNPARGDPATWEPSLVR